MVSPWLRLMLTDSELSLYFSLISIIWIASCLVEFAVERTTAVLGAKLLECNKENTCKYRNLGIDLSPNNKRVYISGIGSDKANVIDEKINRKL
jgi:hypothetical protein